MGRMVYYLPSCHSTNEVALKLLQKGGLKNGTIVIADFQKSGKGQRGNSWESEKGQNLLFSTILQPSGVEAQSQFNLNILVSNALHRTILSKCGLDTHIKWPNDILYSDLKLAGILIESIVHGSLVSSCVIGIGLNTNQKYFNEPRAASLAQFIGKPIDRNRFLEKFAEEFEDNFQLDNRDYLTAEKKYYLDKLLGYQKWRDYEDASGIFKGRIVGVTEVGEILIEKEKGLSKYQMKEFRYIY